MRLPGETYRRPDLSAPPEVRTYSEPVWRFHFLHPQCWPGCLRWRTTVRVHGQRDRTIWGGHVE